MARIETVDELRRLYKQPSGRAVDKVMSRLEPHSVRFIGLSPFVVLSTQGSDGAADITPRGENPGFVQVIDDTTLALPDRPGNNRLDSMTNLLENPAVGLMFMIPGVDEVLRIHGTAQIRDDAELTERFAVDGKTPVTILLIHIQESYLHCAKAILRSDIWNPENRIDRATLPSMGQMIKDQVGSTEPAEDQDDMIKRYREVLY